MKPRYVLVRANFHHYIFEDVHQPDPWRAQYLMPRWRWARMCQGRWPA